MLLAAQHPLRLHSCPPAVESPTAPPSPGGFSLLLPTIFLSNLTQFSPTLAILSFIPLTQLRYGLNDGNGSPNCNDATVSCGFYNTPGYNAAVSQNLYGAASGKTATCGTCWELDPVSDPNAANPNATVAGLKSIVVMVNNLCPAASNEKDVSNPLDTVIGSRKRTILTKLLKNPVRSSNSERYQLRRYAGLLLPPFLSPILLTCYLYTLPPFDK